MALQEFALNIISLIMQPLSWIQMVIMSRQSATKNKNRKEKKRVKENRNNY